MGACRSQQKVLISLRLSPLHTVRAIVRPCSRASGAIVRVATGSYHSGIFELVIFGTPAREWLDQAISLYKHGQSAWNRHGHSSKDPPCAGSEYIRSLWCPATPTTRHSKTIPPPSLTTSPRCAITNRYSSNALRAVT